MNLISMGAGSKKIFVKFYESHEILVQAEHQIFGRPFCSCLYLFYTIFQFSCLHPVHMYKMSFSSLKHNFKV